jgi:tape measure domain-containing protein
MAMDMATLGIKVDATDVTKASAELEKLSTAGGKTAKAMSSVEKSMQGLTGLFAGLGLGALAKSVLDTNREMESLRASLKSVMGSAQGAQGAFNAILTFAKDTPYEIKGLTQTFIMLQNMGIKPTHQVMQSLTDQASKLGGSQETLTSIALQLGQAHSKGKLQMEDMVVLMERGVPVMKLLGQVTGKNAAELADMSAKGTITVDMIDKLIVKMGEAAAGSNANAMETLNGKISSLSDAWHSFEDTLLNDKSEGYLKTVVSNWTAWLDYFKDSIAGVGKEFLALEEINNKIVSSKAKISAMSQGGVSGAAWQVAGALTGNSIEGEKNRLSDFIKQREGVIKTTHDVIVAKNQETAATDKLLNSTNEEKKALEQTLQSKKEQEKAAKAAAREQAALAKTFEDTVTSLSLHNIELSKTPRQLEEATLASKGLNKAQIEQAMALWEVGKALEAKKQLNEQEKSQLDSLIDRYNKATMSARDYYSSTLTTTSPDGIKSPMSGADKAPLLSQFDKTTVAEDASKAHEAAKTALDDYNKSLDDAKTKTQDLGAITSAIFDGALGGISLLTGAFTAMTDEITKNTTEMTRLNEEKQKISDFKPQGLEEEAAKFKAEKKNIKELSDLDKKSVQDQMTGARQLAGAASKLFAEKSAGAKAFHAIEVGIAVAQLAMRAKDMAMSAIATIKNIAEGASKLFAQSGWAGFAGVAAMLALMAGLGFAASGGSGSSGGTPPPTDTGTGTVLGDPTAVSESIGKTNELLKTIHASEYVELRGINSGVNNLQGSITKSVSSMFQTGGMAVFQLAAATLTGATGFISQLPGMAGKISEFFIGGKVTQSIVAQGLGTLKTSLADVINGGNVKAYQFADIKTHTSGGIFGSSKDEYSTQYQQVTKDTQESLNGVFKNIGKVMLSTGEFLGKELGTKLGEAVYKSSIPAMRINLLGLTGDAAVKKVTGVISATMDKMSSKLFGDIVKKYGSM